MKPVFQTARMSCRRWLPSDLDALEAVYGDPQVVRWVGDGTPLPRSGCEAWLKVTESNYQKRGYGMFTLEDRESGEIVGFCGLVHPGGQPEAEIKYALLPAYWGQGLASEAVPALLAYGAQHHKLTHIIATVDPENLASQRVLLKAGMSKGELVQNDDGTLTQFFEWHNEL